MTWKTAGIPSFAERIRASFRPHGHHESNGVMRIRQEERRRERTRIARELHDTLLQELLSASMQLCIAEEWLPADSPAKPVLSRVLDIIRRGIAEGRAALQGLRSAEVPSTSLEHALSDFREELTPTEQARLRIVIMGQPRELNPSIREQIYLIAREALLNALHHSDARTVEAEIEYLPGKLRVVVRDNGTGIDPQVLLSGRKSHWGLKGMRERAKSIDAQLRVLSRRGAGAEVEICVPDAIGRVPRAQEN
jgi:signal transduction histidine kinase